MEVEIECTCPKCGEVFEDTAVIEPDDIQMDLD